MFDQRQIATNLKDAREYVGLTIDKACSSLGISPEELIEIEEGRNQVSTEQLERFSKLYRHSVRFFTSSTFEESEPVQLLARTVENLSERDRMQICRFASILSEIGKERQNNGG